MSFRFTTAGESHGPGLITIVEGLPAGLELRPEDLDDDLARRQLGHGRGGRMKIEKDAAVVTAGVRHGRTLGGPIALQVIGALRAEPAGRPSAARVSVAAFCVGAFSEALHSMYCRGGRRSRPCPAGSCRGRDPG